MKPTLPPTNRTSNGAPKGVLIVRPDDAVRWIGLDEAGCAFMDACAAGATLVEAAQARARRRTLPACLQACSPRARSTIGGAAVKQIWNSWAEKIETLVGHSLLAMAARVGIGAVFFLSGRTKVDGFLTVNDSAYTLFQEEYKVPLLPPEFAAHMAAYAEHLLPLLLLLGLATRLSALGLLGMTAVIQIFVYPDAWPTHLTWAVALLYLAGRGAGSLSAGPRARHPLAPAGDNPAMDDIADSRYVAASAGKPAPLRREGSHAQGRRLGRAGLRAARGAARDGRAGLPRPALRRGVRRRRAGCARHRAARRGTRPLDLRRLRHHGAGAHRHGLAAPGQRRLARRRSASTCRRSSRAN